ncbi:MAG: right-handed parallel beta-helix repeat-containing protein [Victivallales bacterium]
MNKMQTLSFFDAETAAAVEKKVERNATSEIKEKKKWPGKKSKKNFNLPGLYRLLRGTLPEKALIIFISMLTASITHATEYHVAQNHPKASDDNPGNSELPFKSISAAAKILAPGDDVIVHEGIYRERVAPERGGEPVKMISYRAAEGESVYIKGSEMWKPEWRKIAPQVYEGDLDPALVKDYNPYAMRILISPPESKAKINMQVRPAEGPKLERTLGQVFVDGIHQNEMESMDELLRNPGSFLVSPKGNSIFVHFDNEKSPENRLVELTVRERIFAPQERGLGYIRVKGFIMEHAANQGPFPQIAAVSSRSGHHWIFECNTIRFAKTVGLDIGSESWGPKYDDHLSHDHLVQYNNVSDNGVCGIAGLRSENVVIRRNVVERNNSLGYYPPFDGQWWEQAGIKCHLLWNGVIEDNLIRDNEAFGVWLDNGDRGSRISRNLILNNMFAGVFIELSCGPCTVDNNIVAYTRDGDGVLTHDAVNLEILNNLLYYNSNSGVYCRTTGDRGYSPHHQHPKYAGKPSETSEIKILGNIIGGNNGGAVCLPVAGERAKDNLSDYNFFAHGGSHVFRQENPLFLYAGTSFKSLMLQLEDLIKSGSLPEDARLNFASWNSQGTLTLPLWQKLSSNDVHSLAGGFPRNIVRSRDCNLEIDIAAGSAFTKLQCPSSTSFRLDYFGNTVPDKNMSAGPIQGLAAGRQKLYLWPKKEF